MELVGVDVGKGADVGAGVLAMVGYAVTSITSTTGATVKISITSKFASSVRPVEAASSITAAVNAPLATALSTNAKTARPSSIAVLVLLSSHPSAEHTAVEVNSYSTSIDCIWRLDNLLVYLFPTRTTRVVRPFELPTIVVMADTNDTTMESKFSAKSSSETPTIGAVHEDFVTIVSNNGIEGCADLTAVGLLVGANGVRVGARVVGSIVGAIVGVEVGAAVGAFVGLLVGALVGLFVGGLLG